MTDLTPWKCWQVPFCIRHGSLLKRWPWGRTLQAPSWGLTAVISSRKTHPTPFKKSNYPAKWQRKGACGERLCERDPLGLSNPVITRLRTETASAQIHGLAHSPNWRCQGHCQEPPGGSPECAENSDTKPARGGGGPPTSCVIEKFSFRWNRRLKLPVAWSPWASGPLAREVRGGGDV